MSDFEDHDIEDLLGDLPEAEDVQSLLGQPAMPKLRAVEAAEGSGPQGMNPSSPESAESDLYDDSLEGDDFLADLPEASEISSALGMEAQAVGAPGPAAEFGPDTAPDDRPLDTFEDDPLGALPETEVVSMLLSAAEAGGADASVDTVLDLLKDQTRLSSLIESLSQRSADHSSAESPAASSARSTDADALVGTPAEVAAEPQASDVEPIPVGAMPLREFLRGVDWLGNGCSTRTSASESRSVAQDAANAVPGSASPEVQISASKAKFDRQGTAVGFLPVHEFLPSLPWSGISPSVGAHTHGTGAAPLAVTAAAGAAEPAIEPPSIDW